MLTIKTRFSTRCAFGRGVVAKRRTGCWAVWSQKWEEIEIAAGLDVLEGYTVLPGGQPSAAATTTLPTESDVSSSKSVVLYRDTNGWCPFCHRVWMALHEKGVEFDTVLINLQNKPEWYKEVASNSQTPAVRLDGEYMCESLDILLALEKRFPEVTLMPAAEATAISDFLDASGDILVALNKGQRQDASADDREALISVLDGLEAIAKHHGGPFLFGKLTLADIALAPFLPMLGLLEEPALNLSSHPTVQRAVSALMERESYRVSATDLWTRKRLMAFFRSMSDSPSSAEGQDVKLAVPEAEMRDRREAAAKLAKNRSAVLERVVPRCGVLHAPGSAFGSSHMRQPDGTEINVYVERVEAVAEQAVHRVCMQLLTGHCGESPGDAEAVSIQVSVVAYMRNLVSAPRDMSSGAAYQMHAACDAVLKHAYEFPEPALLKKMQEQVANRKAENSKQASGE